MIPLAEQFKPLHKEQHVPLSQFARSMQLKAGWKEIARIMNEQFDIMERIENGSKHKPYLRRMVAHEYQNKELHDFYSIANLKVRYKANNMLIAEIELGLKMF